MNEMNGTERRLNLSQDSQLAERDVVDSESNVSPFLKASYIALKVPILNMDNLCSSDKIMAKAFKKPSKSSQNSKPGLLPIEKRVIIKKSRPGVKK